MTVAASLCWLAACPTRGVHFLFQQLLRIVAWMIDWSPWLLGATANVVHAPLPRGPVRARRIPGHLKNEIARAAAEGHLAESGAKVMTIMRWRPGWMAMAGSTKAANRFTRTRVAVYWRAVRAALAASPLRHYSLAWDGTRAGMREVLVAALWSPALRRAVWLPPQARDSG